MRRKLFPLLSFGAVALLAGCSGDEAADTTATTIDFGSPTSEAASPSVNAGSTVSPGSTAAPGTTEGVTTPLTYQVVGSLPQTGGESDLTVLVEGSPINDVTMVDLAARLLENESDVGSVHFIDDGSIAPLVVKDAPTAAELAQVEAHLLAEMTGTTLTFRGVLSQYGTVEVAS